MKHFLRISSAVTLALLVGCGASSEPQNDTSVAGSEDELVATFDQDSHIDLTKRTHIVLVGDSDELGVSPLHAATTRARRYAELYPNDQIVLFVTQDVKDADVTRSGATIVTDEPFGDVRLADLKRLTDVSLIAAMDRFAKIASVDFFGHSSPFGLLLESEGDARKISGSLPNNVASLKDNFEKAANPYVTLNGCNGGVHTAGELSRTWGVPVSGAFAASNFQVLRADGHYYRDDKTSYPDGLAAAATNQVSFTESQPACSKGSCSRMRPDNYPYYGIWAPKAGMQYGLNYYKFFCEFSDVGACQRGMAASLYASPSDHPVSAASSKDDIREALADFFCIREQDPAWFEQCKAGLFDSVDNGTPFSPMKVQNDYSLECDFKSCQQEFRCTVTDNTPQYGTCTWLSANCPKDISSPKDCRAKNTTKRTTANEFAAYVAGHAQLHH